MFVSSTNVDGHSRSSRSAFDIARGRLASSNASSSNALGDRWISAPSWKSWRVS
jgi:hypothetical protein